MHVIEPAASGRARCRGCGRAIARGQLRLGERLPNPFADAGDMTLWFHLWCGAYRRPEVLAEALEKTQVEVDGREALLAAVAPARQHPRLPRLSGAERAPSGRARCRSCREPIGKAAWRIGLVFHDEGRFSPGGFIHASCARDYFGTAEVIDRLRCFSGELSGEDVAEIRALLEASPAGD